jgi:NAD+ synthase
MTTLYAIAQSTGYRVIGTGNASEAFIGWTTKWGDSAYDLNPIYHLTCTEVVEIGKVLAEEFGLNPKYVEKSPSDGLTGRTDEDNFGFTYEQLDRVIKGDCMVERDVQDKIQKMWMSSRHKTRMPYTMEK